MKRAVPFLSLAIPAFASITVEQFSPRNFTELFVTTDRVTVYEGLPHPLFEKDLLLEEKTTKEWFSICEEAFYKQPLEIDGNDLKELDRILTDEPVCKKWGGYKLCGGFHADYAVEWSRKGESVAVALICFGCGEMLFVEGDRRLLFHMTKDGDEHLRSVLGHYRVQRPPFQQPVPPQYSPAHVAPPSKVELEP